MRTADYIRKYDLKNGLTLNNHQPFLQDFYLDFQSNVEIQLDTVSEYTEINFWDTVSAFRTMEVAKSLELIGGKWKGNKIMGFVFLEDPTDLLEEIATGEKRDLKKEYQFFGTPNSLADELVWLAEIKYDDDILEPSAGQGAIVKAIQRETHNSREVWGYELMSINQKFLNKIDGFKLLGDNFLTECDTSFDKIIANPPFSNNQDIDHIRKMYECLKVGGRLVTIASTHWVSSTNKKETEFRNWLSEIKAKKSNVPSGSFKESGTMIKTVILVINK